MSEHLCNMLMENLISPGVASLVGESGRGSLLRTSVLVHRTALSYAPSVSAHRWIPTEARVHGMPLVS